MLLMRPSSDGSPAPITYLLTPYSGPKASQARKSFPIPELKHDRSKAIQFHFVGWRMRALNFLATFGNCGAFVVHHASILTAEGLGAIDSCLRTRARYCADRTHQYRHGLHSVYRHGRALCSLSSSCEFQSSAGLLVIFSPSPILLSRLPQLNFIPYFLPDFRPVTPIMSFAPRGRIGSLSSEKSRLTFNASSSSNAELGRLNSRPSIAVSLFRTICC